MIVKATTTEEDPVTDAASQTSYDEVPYPSLCYTQTHPNRLATVAMLFGMTPAPVTHCRVLELGCASGGNLIPMACWLSESEFVGIDYAARQIAEGRALTEALGLQNISLKHMDILDVGADLGQFDYIVAHGLYSWVPPAVQDKVLQICKQNLAVNGVAYVSYNTYPGWHMLGMIREMMLFHTRELTEPSARAAGARALLDFLVESLPSRTDAYSAFLRDYRSALAKDWKGTHSRRDAFLLHDELEEVNDPVYFYQFAQQAARHGLQYLGAADFSTMVTDDFAPEARQALAKMVDNLVDLEQYIDFLRHRTLRRTLLCHEELVLNRKLTPEQVEPFLVASQVKPESPDLDLRSLSVTKFVAPSGATFSTDHPVSKAAMLYLAEVWPRPVPFKALLSEASSRVYLGSEPMHPEVAARDASALGVNLLTAYGHSGNMVELYLDVPHFVLKVSDRPVACPLARLQSPQSELVTNLRHERVRLNAFEQRLLPYLDGTRDRVALADVMSELVSGGSLVVREGDRRVTDLAEARSIVIQQMDRALQWLARAALLVG